MIKIDSLKPIFYAAAKISKAGYDFCSTKMQHVGAALFSASSTLDKKNYRAVKLFSMAALCLFSMTTLNIEGAIGAGFATIDDINRLDEIGERVMNTLPENKPS